jgi:hypothetical protein
LESDRSAGNAPSVFLGGRLNPPFLLLQCPSFKLASKFGWDRVFLNDMPVVAAIACRFGHRYGTKATKGSIFARIRCLRQ